MLIVTIDIKCIDGTSSWTCSNPGLTIGKVSHKISLFADKIILILSNPTTSLAEAHKLQTWFGKVSYYKLNKSESHILDLKLDSTTKNLPQAQYPFTWPDKSISYIGIHLPRSVKQLFSVNYKPLLAKLQSETQPILKQKLSWSGRLAAF